MKNKEDPKAGNELIDKMSKSFASIDTKKFLKTNMDKYFESHDDEKCFGC
jgi:hypothetical protein